MKVDYVVKNAKIFTSDGNRPAASAFAVKDGRFVCVGDEDSVKDAEGEVIDLGGKFVMPGIIDAHQHIGASVATEYTPPLVLIMCDGKQECLRFIRDHIAADPGRAIYKFVLPFYYLHGEKLTCRDLDQITADAQIVIMEEVGHSGWVNSKVLRDFGITDDVEDIAPDLSRYDRDEDGRLTGFATEAAFQPFNFGYVKDITDGQIRETLEKYIAYCVRMGITCAYEAGTPACLGIHERVLKILCDLDREGKLPVTVESSYMIMDPRQIANCVEVLKEWDRKYHTEHVRCRIMKIMMDGILAGRSAALTDPYDDGTFGGRITDEKTLSGLLVRLNEEGIDFHAHTVGELAAKTVLDAVELAEEKTGEKLKIHVTCAHLGTVREEDLLRFAPLGVIANFTPAWHGGNALRGGVKAMFSLLGEQRGADPYRCGTLWNSGALVTFSSDNIAFFDFADWSPYQGMEVGILRRDVALAEIPGDYSTAEFIPQERECMTIEQMLLGYTINGAKQLRIDGSKGSIEAGKDADFIVLKEDLLKISPEGMREIVPEAVFYQGRRKN